MYIVYRYETVGENADDVIIRRSISDTIVRRDRGRFECPAWAKVSKEKEKMRLKNCNARLSVRITREPDKPPINTGRNSSKLRYIDYYCTIIVLKIAFSCITTRALSISIFLFSFQCLRGFELAARTSLLWPYKCQFDQTKYKRIIEGRKTKKKKKIV